MPKLIKYSDLPEWMKDNKFIVSGYVPPNNSYRKCLDSLTFLHNETGNIYTHLIPSLLSFATMFTCFSFEYGAFLCFYFGAFVCLGMSAVFHSVKCHSRNVAAFGNKLDYLGISVLISTSMFSLVYYGMYDHPRIRYVLWGITSLLGSATSLVSLDDSFRTPDWRPYRAGLFVAFGLSGILPVLIGFGVHGIEECMRLIQLKFVLLEAVFYIGGAALYAARIPERYNPGKYDYWFHSHQIFHVMVVVAALCHRQALVGAHNVRYAMLQL